MFATLILFVPTVLPLAQASGKDLTAEELNYVYKTSGLVDPLLVYNTMQGHPEIKIGEALKRIKVRRNMEATFKRIQVDYEDAVTAFNKRNLQLPWFKNDYLKFTFHIFQTAEESDPAFWEHYYVKPNSLDSLLHGAYELARRLGSSPFERLAVWKTKSQPGLLVSGCDPVGDVGTLISSSEHQNYLWSCTVSIVPSHFKVAHLIIKNFIEESHAHIIDAEKDLEKEKIALANLVGEQFALNQKDHSFCRALPLKEDEAGNVLTYGVFWSGVEITSDGAPKAYSISSLISRQGFSTPFGAEQKRLIAQAQICGFQSTPQFGVCRLVPDESRNNGQYWSLFSAGGRFAGEFPNADEGIKAMINTPECLVK